MDNCRNCNHSCDHKNHGQTHDADYLVKLYIELEGDKGEEYYQGLKSNLMHLSGIKEVRIEGACFEIIYDDMIISPEEITEVFK